MVCNRISKHRQTDFQIILCDSLTLGCKAIVKLKKTHVRGSLTIVFHLLQLLLNEPAMEYCLTLQRGGI